ncbi:MAG: peptide ABC transporter substrate-binding protein [Thermaerobacter sp.]|nr:peptide ABC transporter substrate-binding protein [Thermaerobacter sp.]
MARRKWIASMASVMGAGLLTAALAACGGPATPSAAVPQAITLVGGVQTEPNWWFPIVPVSVCSTSNFGISMLYHPLLWISRQDTVNFSRSIASSIAVTNNDTVYTIHLKSSWHWSNGSPVTAADVVYAWDIVNASAQSSAPWLNCGAGIGGIPSDWQSVTALNSSTVQVVSKKPVNPVWFEINGIGQLIPIPKQLWDHTSNMTQELKWINTVGNRPFSKYFSLTDGPYKLTKFVSNGYWTFAANPNYSGHVASIKHITFEYETSTSNEFAQLRRGAFSMAQLGPSLYRSRNELTGYQDRTPGYSFGINYVQPNLSPQTPGIGNLFSKLYIRQALQMGIDQPVIAQKLYLGFATPEWSPVPSQPPNAFYDKALTDPYPYNISGAIKLLQQHGWSMVNGVMQRNGQKLSFPFLYMSGSQTDTNIAQLLQQDWAKEGVQVTLRSEPFNQVIATASPSTPTKWVMAWWGAGWFYGPDYYPTGGGLYATGGSANTGGYANSTMNTLIAQTYAPGTPAQEQKRLDAYQAYVAQQLPGLFLPEYVGFGMPTPYMVVKPWLHGVVKWYSPIEGNQYNHWTISGS